MFFISTLKHKFTFFTKTHLISLLFCVTLYFFGFFELHVTSCETGFLTRSIVYGKPYLHSSSINLSRLQLLHENLQNFLINTPNKQFNFNIYKYKNLDGSPFSRKHPCSHPNINLYINDYVEQMLQISVNIQMSHQHLSNFVKFTNYDVRNNEILQFINKTVSLYDLNKVSPFLFEDQKLIFKFINTNYNELIEHYKCF